MPWVVRGVSARLPTGKNEPPDTNVAMMPAITATRATPMRRSGQLRLSQSMFPHVNPGRVGQVPGRTESEDSGRGGRHRTLPRPMTHLQRYVVIAEQAGWKPCSQDATQASLAALRRFCE